MIAGIDPGTVSAYAVLDIEGNIIDVNSGRGINHSQITLKIIKHGRIFLIGSDVKNSPSVVEKIARKIGAKVVSPDHDLGYFEKIKIVDSFFKTKKEFVKIENKHERDALAAALYGFKRLKSLIKKIDDHLQQNNKMYLIEDVKRKVLVGNMTISDAVKSLG